MGHTTLPPWTLSCTGSLRYHYGTLVTPVKVFSLLSRHLLSLKHYDGDIEELTLNFTVVNNEYGQSKVC